MFACKIMVTEHMACPFGSCSAVYNWERVGSLLATLGRRVLNLALLRYVDDFYAPERQVSVRSAVLVVVA